MGQGTERRPGRAAAVRGGALHRTAAVLLAVAAALGGLVLGATPASAHANLTGTEPVQGTRVETGPAAVTLRFTEGVGLSDRSVQVVDGTGGRVDAGPPTHPDGRGETVSVPLRPGLPRGTYTVVWRVVSADSHPIAGSFSFGVAVEPGVARTVVSATSPDSVAVHGVARAISLAAAAGLVGGVAFCLLVWPAGLRSGALRRLVEVSWWASLGATTVLLLVQGPYGSGQNLLSVLDPGLLGTTAATRYGQLLLLRLVLLAVAAPLLRRLATDRTVVTPLAGLGTLFILTFSLAEHAGQGRLVVLAVLADALHATAACVWLGGLAALLVAVLGRRPAGGPRPDLPALLPRWSQLATVAVAVILGTGSFQAWREVGDTDALTGTTYGRLLIGKLALVAVMLAVAATARTLLLRVARRDGDPAGTALRLHSRVRLETVAGGLVVVVTAALVGTVPARDSYDTPFSRTVQAVGVEGDTMRVIVAVDSIRSGLTSMHVYTYTSYGDPMPATAVSATLRQQARQLGPIKVDLREVSPGHARTETLVVPAAGTWTVSVRILTDETTAWAATTTYEVRG